MVPCVSPAISVLLLLLLFALSVFSVSLPSAGVPTSGPRPCKAITHLQLIVLNFSHYLGDSSAFLITGSLYDTHQCSPDSFLCIVVSSVSLASNCLLLYIDLLGPIPISTPGVAILIVLVSGVCGQRSVWLSPSFPGFPGALFPSHFAYSTRWLCK